MQLFKFRSQVAPSGALFLLLLANIFLFSTVSGSPKPAADVDIAGREAKYPPSRRGFQDPTPVPNAGIPTPAVLLNARKPPPECPKNCGDVCCELNESCLQPSGCCAGTACGSNCCPHLQVCVDSALSKCCPSAQKCGKKCCKPTESCVNGTCCPRGKRCGNTCCTTVGDIFPFERFCASASSSLCCFEKTDFACGGACCPGGMRCVGAKCLHPFKTPEQCKIESPKDGRPCQSDADCTPPRGFTGSCAIGCCYLLEIPRR